MKILKYFLCLFLVLALFIFYRMGEKILRGRWQLGNGFLSLNLYKNIKRFENSLSFKNYRL